MDDMKKELVSKVVDETVSELTEEALIKLYPQLIKATIASEVKNMIVTLLSWFIYLVCTFLILNILYLSDNNIVEDASLEMVTTLQETIIIKNYLLSGIMYLLVFSFLSYISSKIGSKSYEKNRRKIIELRNIIYLLFIVSFCLNTFTIDQLDLVSLMISLVLLFKVVFQTDNTFSENELKDMIKKQVIDDWNQEIENKSEELSISENIDTGKKKIIKRNMTRNSNNEDDALIFKLNMIIYFFYGLVLLFYGNRIELFYKNISSIQNFGLFLIAIGLFSHSFRLVILEKKVSLITRFINLLISVTLFCIALSAVGVELKLPFILKSNYSQFIFFTIFMISVRVTSNLIIAIQKINKSIADPTQKLTILIGFFGILISLLTILN